MVCHGSTRTLNGLLDAAIEHGPSGKKSNSQSAHSHYLSLKKYVQHSFRVAYWNYINDLISPHKEDGKYQGQKRFWSYIKSLKQDYSGIAPLSTMEK